MATVNILTGAAMSPANDLRIEIYIRSMTQLLGIEQVKRIVLNCIQELETELESNPDLDLPRTLSHSFTDITRKQQIQNRPGRYY